MCPQKWKASARSAFSAAAITPVPLAASKSLPARARNPRRELVATTASLSTHWAGRVGKDAFELEQRVERALGEHVAVGRKHDRIGAARNVELTPCLRVVLLVEELELDLGVGGDEAQRRLERLAERAAGRGEDGKRKRCVALEALDQAQPAAELGAFVVERERGLPPDRDPQSPHLSREREQSDAEHAGCDKSDREPGHQPGVGRRP